MLVCKPTLSEFAKVPPLGVIVGVPTAAMGGRVTDKEKLVFAWYGLFCPVTVIV